MKTFYKDTDITDDVKTESCVHDTYADSHTNMLRIEFENSVKWDAWNPQLGDSIDVHDGGSSLTGKMHVLSVSPGETFTINAISYDPSAAQPVSRSWENVKLSQICNDVAAAYGLTAELMTNDRVYAYLSCDGSGLNFLRSLLRLEDMAYVIYKEKLICYSVQDAESIPPQEDITITGEHYLYDEPHGGRSGYFFSEYRPSLTAGITVSLTVPDAPSWNGTAYLPHVRHDYIKEKTKLFFRIPKGQ